MTSLDVCVACNEPMVTVEPDQITHPCCDPDDTSQPVHSVAAVAHLLADSDWFRQQPGRCDRCGYHPLTQGHAADCESKAAAGFLFAGRNQCADCGEPVNGPGFLKRCEARHKPATP